MNPLTLLQFLGPPIKLALVWFTNAFGHIALIQGSAFGFSIVVVTLLLRTLLFPVFGWQMRNMRRIQAEQRMIAPQLQEIRKKYKKDPQKLNEEMMALYKEHGISPFSQATGCLPLLVQMPILYGLYSGIRTATTGSGAIKHGLGFLWIGNVTQSPSSALKLGLATHWSVLILPVLAAVGSLAQAKMMMQPARKDMTEQELKTYNLSKNMLYLAPGMVLLFGYSLPVGLGIYWLTQSVVMVFQQWLMIGWGGLKVPPWFPGAGRMTSLTYRADGTTAGTASVSAQRRPSPPKRRPEVPRTPGTPPSAPRGISNGRAPRSVTSRAPGAGRASQGSVRRRGRGR